MNDYPQSAVDTAKKVLQFKEDNPDMDCGTLVGWNRANQIAKRENLSEDTIKRTYSFLSRSKVHNTGSYTDKEGNFVCGSIMYDAWGGDSMLQWSKQIVDKLNSVKKIEITGQIGSGQGSLDYFDYVYSEIDIKEDIEVEINSLGGDFFTAVNIFSKLQKHEGKTKAIYTGLCASAATIIASACDTVEMYDTGAILIHDLSQYVDVYGQLKKEDIESLLEDLQHNIKNLETLNDLAVIMYCKKTGKDKETIKNLMSEDRWILSEEAYELGLVDNVIKDKKGVKAEVKIAASKAILNKHSMDLKERLKEIFASAEEPQKEEQIKSEISEEVQVELTKINERIDAMEAMLIEIKTQLEGESESEEVETEDETEATKEEKELEMRVNAIEARDKSIAQVLEGFVAGMKKEFKSALQEQEQKIKQTVTELQLKENSIVTGDKTFEQKTVTTQDWINQLKNFKN